MNVIELEYSRGLHVRNSVLWFDSVGISGVSIMSQATQGSWRIRRALCSDTTRDIVRVSRPSFSPLVVPWKRSVAIGEATVELYPSGQMPGAAMAHVWHGDKSVLMAGRVCTQPFDGAEVRCEVKADVLAVRSPDLVLGERVHDRIEAMKEIVDWVRLSLNRGRSPRLRAEWPGPAMEMAIELARAGFPVSLASTVARFIEPYHRAGVDVGMLEPRNVIHGEAVRIDPLPARLPTAGDRTDDFVDQNTRGIDTAFVLHGDRGLLYGRPVMTCPGTTDLESITTLAESSESGLIVLVGNQSEVAAAALANKGLRTECLPRRDQLILL